MIRQTTLILFFIFLNTSINGQQYHPACYSNDPVKINKEYIKSYFTDSWQIVSAPVHWKLKDWYIASAIAGTWVLIYTQDDVIYDFFQRNRSKLTDDFSKYLFDPIGMGLYTLPLLGSMYLYGNITDKNKPKTVALLGLKSFIISGVLGQIIKQVSHRHRPYQDCPPDHRNWDGPVSDIKYTSFPSGHTISAFSIATILAEAYRDKKWIPVVSYSLATLAGLSRINDNKHWATDVFAGAVIGHFVGRFVYRSYAKKSCMSLQPVSMNGHLGLSFSWRF